MPAEITDHGCSEGIEGGNAAIDVEIGGFAGGEGEVAGADGFFKKQGFEFRGGFEHGGGLGFPNEVSIANRQWVESSWVGSGKRRGNFKPNFLISSLPRELGRLGLGQRRHENLVRRKVG